jgi:DNA-binding response OmpR family regulator
MKQNQEREIKQILVVDDDTGMNAMLIKYLRSSGYECRGTADPVEALNILKRGGFELAISDIQMPVMDGLQLLNEIRRHDQRLDVIIMTGFTNDYTYSDIVNAGAADFITKPFELPELKAKVERIDRERKMRKELEHLNITLEVLLQRAEKETETLTQSVLTNVRETVFPHLEKLKSLHLPEGARTHLELLDSNLCEILSPLIKNLSLNHANITSMEVQVANLIKNGKRNKEIAVVLGVSLNTVMTYRFRLRTKLGLKGEKVNLRSYLNSIDF